MKEKTTLLIIAVDSVDTAKELRAVARAAAPGAVRWAVIDVVTLADAIGGRIPPEGVDDYEVPQRKSIADALAGLLKDGAD